MLAQLAPLLNAGLSNKYRAVKNSSLQLWNSTFGQSASLKYPDLLIPSLRKLKEKVNRKERRLTYQNAQISLPSWNNPSEAVNDPPSDPSLEAENDLPPPTIPIPSGRLRSNLTRKISKVENKSPSKVLKTKGMSNTADTNHCEANSNVHDKDYVEIPPTSHSHSTILTDHQLEVLQEQKKEKPVLMAYSGLDLSQDPNEFRNPFDLSLLRRTPDGK